MNRNDPTDRLDHVCMFWLIRKYTLVLSLPSAFCKNNGYNHHLDTHSNCCACGTDGGCPDGLHLHHVFSTQCICCTSHDTNGLEKDSDVEESQHRFILPQPCRFEKGFYCANSQTQKPCAICL